MAKDLSKIAKEKKIKYFLISFVDLFGILRSKLVPTQAIREMQKNGAGFAGFATWLEMTPMGRLAKPSEIASVALLVKIILSSFSALIYLLVLIRTVSYFSVNSELSL